MRILKLISLQERKKDNTNNILTLLANKNTWFVVEYSLTRVSAVTYSQLPIT